MGFEMKSCKMTCGTEVGLPPLGVGWSSEQRAGDTRRRLISPGAKSLRRCEAQTPSTGGWLHSGAVCSGEADRVTEITGPQGLGSTEKLDLMAPVWGWQS